MNVRNAILAAADLIERNPELWAFNNTEVPPCGSPGCAIGLIGALMGAKVDTVVSHISLDVVSVKDREFYNRMTDINCAMPNCIGRPSWHDSAEVAAECLRIYADKYHANSTTKTGLPDVVRKIFRQPEAA